MAAQAPSFDQAGVRVALDPVKGRVVYSDRAFQPGDVVFREQAFVYAPWATDVCAGCEESSRQQACHCKRTGKPRAWYSPKLNENPQQRSQLVDFMASLDGISEVDRARCILKCLALVERDANALQEVLQLTCANYDEMLEVATKLRAHAAAIFPNGFTDAQMATLIGVLNTNSHELENLGGSGLFLSACRMEHNCMPNCSFTTYGSELWMTAIQPIAPGDAMSIDYGNFFYRPTEERISSLVESYGFLCTCNACRVNPDVCRSFRCPAGCVGVVWPYPKPMNQDATQQTLEFEWKCNGCGKICSEEESDAFEDAEQNLLDEGFPESVEEVDALIQQGVFHPHHYLLFWALDTIGCDAVAQNSFQPRDGHHLASIWERIITSMNAVVPYAHHEKTIYYDNLAQVQIVLGDRTRAYEAYKQAYEISCLVSGRDCEPTHKLLKLMQNPPQNAQELRQIYAADARPQRASREDDDAMED